MTLERWRQEPALMPLREAMDRLFEEAMTLPWGLARLGMLGEDLYERDDAYHLDVPLPGARPEDMEVTVTGNTVTLRGNIPCWATAEGMTPLRHLRPCGRFVRSLSLPTSVAADQVEATYEHGVIRLRLPKAPAVRRRAIPVRAGMAAAPRPEAQAPAPEARPGAAPSPAGQPSPAAAGMPGAAPGPMAAGRWQLRVGMEVMGSDGKRAGRVKEVRENDFLIDRPMARDIYVPMSAITDVQGDRIMINVPADQVDDQGWPSPALTPPPATEMEEV